MLIRIIATGLIIISAMSCVGYKQSDKFSRYIDGVVGNTRVPDDILPDIELSIYDDFIKNEHTDYGVEYYAEFKEFNVPMTMTPRVNAYIKYFTERVPDTTQMWLNRSNKYIHIVMDIFIKEGLPTDLVVLAFTESGFNTHAISHAGAGGMWQFMPRTGRIYGMYEDMWVDDRRDFELATYAAAQYLKELYRSFGDWYLALAAYNAGPGKVSRAARANKSRDFFVISENKNTLKLETRDYVPKFLALLIIYKNYLKYGFEPPTESPLLYDKIDITSQLNTFWLATKLGVEHQLMRELNPSLKLPMTPLVDSYQLRVPYGMSEVATELIANATKDEMAQYIVYYAKDGEKLSTIAKRNSVSLDTLQKLNSLRYDELLSSRIIYIPIKGANNSMLNDAFARELVRLAPKYYRVKKGDTFIAIAHKHNMRSGDLRELNPDVDTSKITVGQRLVIATGS